VVRIWAMARLQAQLKSDVTSSICDFAVVLSVPASNVVFRCRFGQATTGDILIPGASWTTLKALLKLMAQRMYTSASAPHGMPAQHALASQAWP
jgi:hypothetical protein